MMVILIVRFNVHLQAVFALSLPIVFARLLAGMAHAGEADVLMY